MKSEKLFDAMTHIREDILSDTDKRYTKRRRLGRRIGSAVAAVLVVAILCGVLLEPFGGSGTVLSPLVGTAHALAAPEYPQMASYPEEAWIAHEKWKKDYEKWQKDIDAQRGERGYADSLNGFFTDSIRTFLSGAKRENVVYSPLNVYMALAMLAEVSDGDSREQILTLLGHEDLESLRAQANMLWNANYRNDGATTSVLASSLWLSDALPYVQSTVDTLAGDYYASVFQGTMGSDEMNKALQNWLNEQTGGLLGEYVEGVELSPETVLALATTVYFKARWGDTFNEANTRAETFHAPKKDLTCDFMHSRGSGFYYWGDKFSAVSLGMENAGAMHLILPDEGYSVDDLLKDEQAMTFALSRGNYDDCKNLIINLSLPKFDVSSELDLKGGLMKLGVNDVFKASAADFSAITDAEDIRLAKVQHAARVVIDEEGCTAAAYTAILLPGSAEPPDEEVDFVLDRPFLFVLTGIDDLPLFVGVVNRPV